jgi:hypothetical protein
VTIVNNLGFLLNGNLTAVDHSKRVCRRDYSIRPHASHTPFLVRKRLVQSLVTPHINYGNIVYSSVDVAFRGRIRVAFNACLRYIHRVRPRDHISHLKNSVTGMILETSAMAQLLCTTGCVYLHPIVFEVIIGSTNVIRKKQQQTILYISRLIKISLILFETCFSFNFLDI